MSPQHSRRRAREIAVVAIATAVMLAVCTVALGASQTRRRHPVHQRVRHVTTTTKRAAKQAAVRKTTTTTAPRKPALAPITLPTVPLPTLPLPTVPLPPVSVCLGVPMNAGQPDIDRNPPGTTFCLSGTHNWALTPKTGDQFIGPAVLDGQHTTSFAFQPGDAANVVIQDLEIRNYVAGKDLGAILSDATRTGNPDWVLRDLQVHDIGSAAGGAGVALGPGWQVIGGRYYNNRQEGLTDFRGDGAVVDGAEIDHNNFTDDAYTTREIDCGDEAGGFKFFADNVTVRNSRVHDNACVGLWSDGNAHNSVIENNQVYDNWNEGIFIEISDGSMITGNTVYGNGLKGGGGSNSFGCTHWMYGGGIVAASSANVTVAYNTVSANCNGITGTQEPRPDGNPGLLENFSVHDNSVSGPGGDTGVASYPVVDLSGRDITFSANLATDGMDACGMHC